MRLHLPAVTLTELAIFVTALPLVAGIRAVLWLLPSRMALRLAQRVASLDEKDSLGGKIAPSTVIWAIDAASRRVPRATCLTQALSAKLLLHSFGHSSQLCLGVARDERGQFRAHAWLERHGRPVLGGSGIHDYVRLPGLHGEADIRVTPLN